jgi:MFS family permease
MGALQSSVPFGVMIGYIIAAILVGPVTSTDMCFHILCWRWPLLLEWAILLPFCIAIHFVPSSHFAMNVRSNSTEVISTAKHSSYDTFGNKSTVQSLGTENTGHKKIKLSLKANSFAQVESNIFGHHMTSPQQDEVCHRTTSLLFLLHCYFKDL